MRWLCQVIEHEAIDNNSGIGSMGVSLVSIHEIIRIKTRVVDHQIKKITHHERNLILTLSQWVLMLISTRKLYHVFVVSVCSAELCEMLQKQTHELQHALPRAVM